MMYRKDHSKKKNSIGIFSYVTIITHSCDSDLWYYFRFVTISNSMKYLAEIWNDKNERRSLMIKTWSLDTYIYFKRLRSIYNMQKNFRSCLFSIITYLRISLRIYLFESCRQKKNMSFTSKSFFFVIATFTTNWRSRHFFFLQSLTRPVIWVQ